MLKDIDLICRLNREWLPDNIKIKKAGGQTNRNYIVHYKGRKFFVRLPWEKASVVNRKIEASNILALQGNSNVKSILPKYYVFILNGKNVLQSKNKEIFDLPDGAMMTEYVAGKVFNSLLFRQDKYREKLAHLFHIFHSSGVRFKNEYNVFRDEVAKYRIEAKKYPILKIINKEMLSQLNIFEMEAKKNIPGLKKGISTHNDFILQNFIAGNNGKSYLLDFEYAGLNKKGGILYDFGFLFADNLFRNPPITQELFEKFLDGADRIYEKKLARDQIYWLAIAAMLVMIWWGIIRYFNVKTQKEKSYFKNYILRRIKGLKFVRKLVAK